MAVGAKVGVGGRDDYVGFLIKRCVGERGGTHGGGHRRRVVPGPLVEGPEVDTKVAQLDVKVAQVDTKVDLLATQFKSDRDEDRRTNRVRHYWLAGISLSALVSIWLGAAGVIS